MSTMSTTWALGVDFARRHALSRIESKRQFRGLTLPIGPAEGYREATVVPGPQGDVSAVLAQLDEVRQVHAVERHQRCSAEQSRLSLISFMSHDLRTPLAGIRALSEALEDGVVTDVPQTMVQMQRLVQRMTVLVDDLMALAQLQGQAPVRLEREHSLLDVVRDVADELRPVGVARRVALDVVHDEDPLIIFGVPEDLARALSNLVMNALRHTEPEHAVGITAARTRGGGIEVTVTDGCGGIPDEHLPHLFDAGWSGTPVRGACGGGLGLAICRRIVQAHAGEVAVQNVLGGCQFRIELPAALRAAA